MQLLKTLSALSPGSLSRPLLSSDTGLGDAGSFAAKEDGPGTVSLGRIEDARVEQERVGG